MNFLLKRRNSEGEEPFGGELMDEVAMEIEQKKKSRRGFCCCKVGQMGGSWMKMGREEDKEEYKGGY
jgi:hypothetical protein